MSYVSQFNVHQAIATKSAITTSGHRVCALAGHRNPRTKEPYLLGFNWQPHPQGVGIVGMCEWDVRGNPQNNGAEGILSIVNDGAYRPSENTQFILSDATGFTFNRWLNSGRKNEVRK